jgi:hypothetical protein
MTLTKEKYNMQFDKHGYINNQGNTSKYWGVTISGAGTGDLCVSFVPKGTGKTVTLYLPTSASITKDQQEKDCARIAAMVRDIGLTNISKWRVRDCTGAFLYRILCMGATYTITRVHVNMVEPGSYTLYEIENFNKVVAKISDEVATPKQTKKTEDFLAINTMIVNSKSLTNKQIDALIMTLEAMK